MFDRVIRNNEKKAILASAQEIKGYYRNLSLEHYDTFVPHPYSSFKELISFQLSNKKKCRILEICCGEAIAAKELKQCFGDHLEYHALDIVKPLDSSGIMFYKCGLDSFETSLTFDIIFSINGLIYGYDDKKNFFNYLKYLNKNGFFLFNFSGLTNPIEIDKKTEFYNFLSGYFLYSLHFLGFKNQLVDFGREYVFFGHLENNLLSKSNVLKLKKELEKEKKIFLRKNFEDELKEFNINDLRGNSLLILDSFNLHADLRFFSFENLCRYVFPTNLPITSYIFYKKNKII
jgi:hypothetical protein